MRRPLPWIWIVLAAILLLAPGPAGRLVLEILGGLTIAVVLLPLFFGAAALVAWQVFRRRLRTCDACGFSSLGSDVCPACGHSLALDPPAGQPLNAPDIDASHATITVEATDVDSESSTPPPDGH